MKKDRNLKILRERERESSNLKNDKAITLIALVITIIVLLILAGVTIVTFTGDNGLLQKASDAKQTSLDSEIEEEVRLAWNKVYADSYLDTTLNKAGALRAELLGKDNNATVIPEGEKLKVEYRGRTITLDPTTGSLDIKTPLPEAAAGNWFSNILASDNTAHNTWMNLQTGPIPNPTSLKYQTASASVMQGKAIRKIALQNPEVTGLYIDFYTADDGQNNKITNLSEKLATVNLNSDGNVEEYTLTTPVSIPTGKTLVMYISGAFCGKVRATWATTGSIYYSFGSEPSEGMTIGTEIAWSAFDFYLT